MIGILSVYVAVSQTIPKWVVFLGQQLAWISVGCVICLIVTIFSTKFLWKILLSLPAWPSLDGSSPCFYNPNLQLQQELKLGGLWEHHLISAFRIYEDPLHP